MGKRKYEQLSHKSKAGIEAALIKICDNWGIPTVGAAIPADIQLRAYKKDCYKENPEEPEHNARNWGLLLLQDVHKISSLTKGNLKRFQNDIRKEVNKRNDEKPYTLPEDIRRLKKKYETVLANKNHKSSIGGIVPTIVYKHKNVIPGSQPTVEQEPVNSSLSSLFEDTADDEEEEPVKRGLRGKCTYAVISWISFANHL